MNVGYYAKNQNQTKTYTQTQQQTQTGELYLNYLPVKSFAKIISAFFMNLSGLEDSVFCRIRILGIILF